jgi:hypothetical protein
MGCDLFWFDRLLVLGEFLRNSEGGNECWFCSQVHYDFRSLDLGVFIYPRSNNMNNTTRSKALLSPAAALLSIWFGSKTSIVFVMSCLMPNSFLSLQLPLPKLAAATVDSYQ